MMLQQTYQSAPAVRAHTRTWYVRAPALRDTYKPIAARQVLTMTTTESISQKIAPWALLTLVGVMGTILVILYNGIGHIADAQKTDALELTKAVGSVAQEIAVTNGKLDVLSTKLDGTNSRLDATIQAIQSK